jgi:hypothetical protein
MKTRDWILVGIVAVLGLWYAWSFTEWLHAEPIQIQAQVRELPRDRAFGVRRANAEQGKAPRPPRPDDKGERRVASAGMVPGGPAGAPAGRGRRGDPGFGSGPDYEGNYPVVFALDGEYKLTSLLVIEAEATNHAPLIVWQVNTESNSVPTKALIYGHVPRGMRLKYTNEPAKKLEAGVLYRLELKAGRYAGSTTFRPKEVEEAPPAQ